VLPGLWDMHVHLQIAGHADYDHWDKTYPPAFESIIFPASAKQLLLAVYFDERGNWRVGELVN